MTVPVLGPPPARVPAAAAVATDAGGAHTSGAFAGLVAALIGADPAMAGTAPSADSDSVTEVIGSADAPTATDLVPLGAIAVPVAVTPAPAPASPSTGVVSTASAAVGSVSLAASGGGSVAAAPGRDGSGPAAGPPATPTDIDSPLPTANAVANPVAGQAADTATSPERQRTGADLAAAVTHSGPPAVDRADVGGPRVADDAPAGALPDRPEAQPGTVTALPTTGVAPTSPTGSVAPLPPTAPAAAGAPAALAAQLVPGVTAVHRSAVPGEHQLTVDVTPEQLGPVRVTIELRAGEMHLHLASSSEAGREALRAALPELARQLEATGLSTAALDVRPDDPGARSGWTAAQHQEDRQQPARRGSAAPATTDDHPARRDVRSADNALDIRL